MKITCDRTAYTFNDFQFNNYEEFVIDDEASLSDLLEVFVRVICHQGYAKESLINELQSWVDEGLEDVIRELWF